MLYFLVTDANRQTLDVYLDTFGKPVSDGIEIITYEDALGRDSWMPGSYVFTDIELLDDATAARAGQLWDALSQTGKTRLLNHPQRSMQRFELLRTLYEAGQNRFNVFQLGEVPTGPGSTLPFGFPVILQRRAGKTWSSTPVIYGRRQFDEILVEMAGKNINKDDCLVVEYFDNSDNRGIYTRYACFMVDDVLIPRCLLCSRQWPVRIADALTSEDAVQAERDYLEDTAHFDALADIFRQARIDYGRIDYSLVDGQIQTWGINTNPVIIGQAQRNVTTRLEVSQKFAGRFNEKLQELSALSGDQPVVTGLELNTAV